MAGWHHRLNEHDLWVNPGSWWWTGRPAELRFMGSPRVEHDWVTELNWTELCTTEYLTKITYWHHQVLLEVGERERELRPLLNHNENQKIWGSENRSTCEGVSIIPPKRDWEAISMGCGESCPSHPLCSQYFTLYIRVKKTLLGNRTGPSENNERYQYEGSQSTLKWSSKSTSHCPFWAHSASPLLLIMSTQSRCTRHLAGPLK